jgi:HNH endonuclease
VYCRLPDGVKGEEAFGVDHYRPVSKFPDLDCNYENLFYACNTCNWRKGDFWTALVQAAEDFIPNPCDHRMADHLRFEGARVEPATATGRFAIAMLFLNHPAQIEYRDFVLRSIDRCLRERSAIQSTLAQLDARLVASQDLGRHWLLADRSTLKARLKRLRADLERLTGSVPP